ISTEDIQVRCRRAPAATRTTLPSDTALAARAALSRAALASRVKTTVEVDVVRRRARLIVVTTRERIEDDRRTRPDDSLLHRSGNCTLKANGQPAVSPGTFRSSVPNMSRRLPSSRVARGTSASRRRSAKCRLSFVRSKPGGQRRNVDTENLHGPRDHLGGN